MRYGDEVPVLEDGIRVRPKAVEPMGIYDGSRCWGLWVQGQREPEAVGPVASQDAQARHLVVSPIHPDYWASVFQLEIKLIDAKGALARALKVLKDHDINILFAECAPSGYRHATLNAVCEISSLRAWIRDILAPETRGGFQESALFPGSESVTADAYRERQFQEIGITMVIALAQLWARIRITENVLWESRQRNHFLYPPIVEVGPQPWYVPFLAIQRLGKIIAKSRPFASPWADNGPPPWNSTELKAIFTDLKQRLVKIRHTASQEPDRGQRPTQEALEVLAIDGDEDSWLESYLHRIWRGHWVQPVSINTLLALSYYRIWSRNENPIPFRYDADNSLLKPDSPDAIKEGLEASGFVDYEFPSRAVASFYRFDRFVRFRFLRRKFVKERLAIVHFSYKARRTMGNQQVSPSQQALTPGLMHSVTDPLALTGFDIIRISNHVTEFRRDRESGQIRFAGIYPDEGFASWERRAREQVNNSTAALRNDRVNEFGEKWLDVDIVIRPVSVSRVFLSMPASAIRATETKNLVKAKAENFGYEMIDVDEYTPNSITEEIIHKIGSADAFLQIVVLRELECHLAVDDKGFSPDFRWLDLEYGMARQAGIQIIRILDRSIPGRLINELFAADKDKPSLGYNTQGEFKLLEVSLDKAFKQFRQKESA